MTDLRTLISKEHKAMIFDYITEFATGRDGNHITTDTFLQYWNTAKGRYLYDLLGHQFQISKTLTYNKPMDKLIDEIRGKISRYNSASYTFCRRFDRFLWDNRLTLGDEYYKLQQMVDAETLANTKWEGEDFSVNTPDGRTIKVQSGSRPMRVISRVAKAYGGIEGMEDFQNEISVILTQKKLTGTMTLSIHPMDYMTMSHNDCNWSSCMDWTDEGCYRRGTIEMMNSECVLVAYLAADDDMYFYADNTRYSWNNKKWRELFVVTPDLITGIKGYPYQNIDLVEAINLWIAELAEANLGWKFDNIGNREFTPHQWFRYGDKEMKLSFETNTMYNDFGTTRHVCILRDSIEGDHIYTNYSGEEMCLKCGSTHAYFAGEGYLVCEDCDEHYACADCGDCISGDDIYWLDGDAYCESCFNEHAASDPLDDNEMHNIDNMSEVYLAPDGVSDDEAWDYLGEDYFTTYYINTARIWSKWFNDDAKMARKNGMWGWRYYVTPSMFKCMEDIETLFPNQYEYLEDYLNIEDNLPDEDEE